ncbi:MAG: hypothetical protein R2729_06165 [Bryobacteraceae bacterium]
MTDLLNEWRSDFLKQLSKSLGGETTGLTLLNYEDMSFRTYLRPPIGSNALTPLTLTEDERDRIEKGFSNIKGNPTALAPGTGPDVEKLFDRLIHRDLALPISLSADEMLTAAELLSALRMPPFCLISGAFLAAELDIAVLQPQVTAIRARQGAPPPYTFSGTDLDPFFYAHPAYDSFKFRTSGLAELYELLYSILTGASNTRKLVYWAIPIFSGGIYRGVLFANSSGTAEEEKHQTALRAACEQVVSALPHLDLHAAIHASGAPAPPSPLIRALRLVQPLCFAAVRNPAGTYTYYLRSAAEGAEATLQFTAVNEVIALRMRTLQKAHRRDNEILVGEPPPLGQFEPAKRLHKEVLRYLKGLNLEPTLAASILHAGSSIELYYAVGKSKLEMKQSILSLQTETIRLHTQSSHPVSTVLADLPRSTVTALVFTTASATLPTIPAVADGQAVVLDPSRTLIVRMELRNHVGTLREAFRRGRLDLNPASCLSFGNRSVKWDGHVWVDGDRKHKFKGRTVDLAAVVKELWRAAMGAVPPARGRKDETRKNLRLAFKNLCEALGIDAKSVFTAGELAIYAPTEKTIPDAVRCYVFEDGTFVSSAEYHRKEVSPADAVSA